MYFSKQKSHLFSPKKQAFKTTKPYKTNFTFKTT